MAQDLTPVEPGDAGHLEQFRVHAAHPGVDVEVDREQHAEGDEQYLRRLLDPEPQDEQRHERQMGQRPEHLHRRVDEQPAPAREPRPHPEGEPDDGAEQEAGDDAGEGHREASGQLPAGGDVDRGTRDPRGDASSSSASSPVEDASCQTTMIATGLIQRCQVRARGRRGVGSVGGDEGSTAREGAPGRVVDTRAPDVGGRGRDDVCQEQVPASRRIRSTWRRHANRQPRAMT